MTIGRMWQTILIVLMVFLTINCSKKRPPVLPSPPAEHVTTSTGNSFLVHVAYATDRDLKPDTGLIQAFGGRRDKLRYGHAVVSIPRSHEPGEIELPHWFRLQWQPDPKKHFTVSASSILKPEEWSADVGARVAQSRKKAVFIFIHGYKVPFDDALMRTAQIQHDVTFPGPAILFSWPSKGVVTGYPSDGQDAEWAVPHLLAVLQRTLTNTGVEEVYIIAHSMGNITLTRALKELGEKDPSVRSKIREVILAAPDIDAGIFRDQVAPFLSRAAQRYTLYASSNDLALKTSKKVNGYVRLGDTRPSATIYPPIQTIDASALPADMLGHSYIGDNITVLSDVRKIFMQRATPQARGLIAIGNSGSYWKFPKKVGHAPR